MNEWDQRIREHRIWAEMQVLGPAIDGALGVEDLAPETVAGIQRIKTILTYAGKRLAAADPSLANPQLVEAIASHFTTTQNELTAFLSDKNPAHIVAANLSADAALPNITQIPGEYSLEELGAFISALSDYRKFVQQALTSATQKLQSFDSAAEASTKLLTANATTLQTALEKLAAAIQAEQQRLAQIVSDQQGQFSTAQEARSKEFTENLSARTQEINKLVATYQEQFSNGQNTRSQEFAKLHAEYTKRLTDQDIDFTRQRTEFVAVYKADLVRLTSEYDEKAKEILEHVEAQKERVEKLVGIIGNEGVTAGYLLTANKAKHAMWFWQGLTVAALGAWCVLACFTIGKLEGADGRFNWGIFAARALIMASLGAIAGYSGSQADKLFKDERKNRKLALELEAISPYLEPLPVEEQNKFRVLIGERSFGREQDDAHAQRKSPVSIIDMVKSKEGKDLTDLLIDLIKKAK